MEIGQMEAGEIPNSIQPEQLLKINSKLNINLSNPLQFYTDLIEKLGDFGNFITTGPINTTIDDRIYINDKSVIIGTIIYSTHQSLHDAVLLAILLHKIFKHPFDESCSNLGAFVLNLVGIKTTCSNKIKHYLNLVS